MKVTWFGTTTLLFDDGKDQVLFDAHMTRPSLFTYIFGRCESNAKLIDEMLRVHSIDRLRAIFISHTHHDHVLDAPYIAKKTGAVIYGSGSAMNVGRGRDVPDAQLFRFKAGETYTIGGFRVTVFDSIHSKPTILNNDLGQVIDAPLKKNAKLRDYKEGGSFDFLVEHDGKRTMIRPSFNYIAGQLDGVRADVIFAGVAGLAKADAVMKENFFRETVEKTGAKTVVPIHWDNFFTPLDRPVKGMPKIAEDTGRTLFELAQYCEQNGIACVLQLPRTFVEL